MALRITLDKPLSFRQMGRRSNQEDSRYPDTDHPAATSRVFAVCDGVGGRNKGEVASTVVVEAIKEFTSPIPPSAPFGVEEFTELKEYIYSRLSHASAPENEGMATTLTFLCFSPKGCLVAHMGDSRIYQIRPGRGIIFRTQDHSLVNELVQNGVITPDEVDTHPRRNVITRCLCPPTPQMPRQTADRVILTDILPGDIFVLCSDGVTETWPDNVLEAILTDPKATLLEKVKNIAAECQLNSNDNNTAIFIPIADVASDDAAIRATIDRAEATIDAGLDEPLLDTSSVNTVDILPAELKARVEADNITHNESQQPAPPAAPTQQPPAYNVPLTSAEAPQPEGFSDKVEGAFNRAFSRLRDIFN